MRKHEALKREDDAQREIFVEVAEVQQASGIWTVEAIDGSGTIYQAIFVGPEARERAIEYASFKYRA